MGIELFLYDSPAFKNFLKDNAHERGEVRFLESIVEEGMNAIDDVTSGKETYSAGRDLDLEPDRDRTAEGKWILDFNKAYNPWCVYSEDYTCPLVPPENWLEVPIRAGEKNYSFKVAH